MIGENFIGNTKSAKGNTTFTTFNPQKNQNNPWQFTEATLAEVDAACTLATEAFVTYRKISDKTKALFLRAIVTEIEALGNTLLEVYCLESGLLRDRAVTERARTVKQLNNFATLLEAGNWVNVSINTVKPNKATKAKVDLRKMNIPIGPVVVFGASNFPLAYSTAGGDTASALAAGCPVIVKSHPMHAGTGALVAEAVLKAAVKTGMPNGVFSNLNSQTNAVGKALVLNKHIKAVGFTGSLKAGRALYNLAATRAEPIPVFAEMGSINPVVILPEALDKRASTIAQTIATSITLGAGQFCTNPGIIIAVKSKGLTTFINALSKEIVNVAPACMLHPNISAAYTTNKQKAIDQKGMSVLSEYVADASVNFAKQTLATVDASLFLKNTTLQQEVFGPYSLVVQCANIQELETVVNALEGQLTGTIIAEDKEIENYNTIINALKHKVGRLIFNGVPTGVEVCQSMLHGGPYPATTDSRFTAVGVDAIKRFVRPVSYQSWPDAMLPKALQNKNPLKLLRTVNGVKTTKEISF